MQRRVVVITVGEHVDPVVDSLMERFLSLNPIQGSAEQAGRRVGVLHIRPEGQPVPGRASVPEDKIVPLSLTPAQLQGLYHDQRVRRWSSVNWGAWVHILPSTRLWSKLALFQHYDALSATFTQIVNNLGSADLPLHVYIVAPLHDPFASIITDVAMMAHRLVRENDRVFGLLLLPDMAGDPVPRDREMHRAAAYASLRELNFYESTPSFYSDFNPVQPLGGDMEQTRSDLRESDLRDTSPFIRGDAYLIGGPVRETGEPLTYADALLACADLIFWQTASPLSGKIAYSSHGNGHMSAFGIAKTRIRAVDDALESRRRSAYLLRASQVTSDSPVDMLPVRRLLDAAPANDRDVPELRGSLDELRLAAERIEQIGGSINLSERLLAGAISAGDAETQFQEAADQGGLALTRYRERLDRAVLLSVARARDLELAPALADLVGQPGLSLEGAAEAHREALRLARAAVERSIAEADQWRLVCAETDTTIAQAFARLRYTLQPNNGLAPLILMIMLGVSAAGFLFSLNEAFFSVALLLWIALGALYWTGIVRARRTDRQQALDGAIEAYAKALRAQQTRLERDAHRRYLLQFETLLVAQVAVPPMPGASPAQAIGDRVLRLDVLRREVDRIVAAENAVPPRDLTAPPKLVGQLGRQLLELTQHEKVLVRDWDTQGAIARHIRATVDGIIASEEGGETRAGLPTLPSGLVAEKLAANTPSALLSLDANRLALEFRDLRPPVIAAVGWRPPEYEDQFQVEIVEPARGETDEDMIIIQYRTGIPVRALLNIEPWRRAFLEKCEYLSPTNTRLLARSFWHPTRTGVACIDPLAVRLPEVALVPYLTLLYALFVRWFADHAWVENDCALLGIAYQNEMNWDEFCGALGDNPRLISERLADGALLMRETGRDASQLLPLMRDALQTNRPNATETNADWALWACALFRADIFGDANADRRFEEIQRVLCNLFASCNPVIRRGVPE